MLIFPYNETMWRCHTSHMSLCGQDLYFPSDKDWYQNIFELGTSGSGPTKTGRCSSTRQTIIWPTTLSHSRSGSHKGPAPLTRRLDSTPKLGTTEFTGDPVALEHNYILAMNPDKHWALPHHPMPFVSMFWYCNTWEICLMFCKQRGKDVTSKWEKLWKFLGFALLWQCLTPLTRAPREGQGPSIEYMPCWPTYWTQKEQVMSPCWTAHWVQNQRITWPV